MDFTLSNEQRAWQMTARKFAEEEIRPISLGRDEIDDPRETFDWEIITTGRSSRKARSSAFAPWPFPRNGAGTAPIS